MITRLAIRNFQSLRKVDLNLGPLTVIVGSSSSGKSAMVRSLKALVDNVRGTDYVTRGEKSSSIRAYFDGGGSVTLERGVGVGAYVLDPDEHHTMKYSKLGGAVPEDIVKFLRISTDLCFSQQFDKPYLLTDSGTNVARILGELTNVSRIFSAAREGNRVRLSKSNTLKLRSSDLTALKLKAQEFRSLQSDIALCADVENMLLTAEAGSLGIDRLRSLISKVDTAEVALHASVIPEVPSAHDLTKAFSLLETFKVLWSTCLAQGSRASSAKKSTERYRQEEDELRQELSALLHSAGTCPTCGSDIEG